MRKYAPGPYAVHNFPQTAQAAAAAPPSTPIMVPEVDENGAPLGTYSELVTVIYSDGSITQKLTASNGEVLESS